MSKTGIVSVQFAARREWSLSSDRSPHCLLCETDKAPIPQSWTLRHLYPPTLGLFRGAAFPARKLMQYALHVINRHGAWLPRLRNLMCYAVVVRENELSTGLVQSALQPSSWAAPYDAYVAANICSTRRSCSSTNASQTQRLVSGSRCSTAPYVKLLLFLSKGDHRDISPRISLPSVRERRREYFVVTLYQSCHNGKIRREADLSALFSQPSDVRRHRGSEGYRILLPRTIRNTSFRRQPSLHCRVCPRNSLSVEARVHAGGRLN